MPGYWAYSATDVTIYQDNTPRFIIVGDNAEGVTIYVPAGVDVFSFIGVDGTVNILDGTDLGTIYETSTGASVYWMDESGGLVNVRTGKSASADDIESDALSRLYGGSDGGRTEQWWRGESEAEHEGEHAHVAAHLENGGADEQPEDDLPEEYKDKAEPAQQGGDEAPGFDWGDTLGFGGGLGGVVARIAAGVNAVGGVTIRRPVSDPGWGGMDVGDAGGIGGDFFGVGVHYDPGTIDPVPVGYAGGEIGEAGGAAPRANPGKRGSSDNGGFGSVEGGDLAFDPTVTFFSSSGGSWGDSPTIDPLGPTATRSARGAR